MIDYERWKLALARTESHNVPEAWGDHNSKHLPLACGRWQMHPVFIDRWWPDDFPTTDATTWDDLFDACLHAFFLAYVDEVPSAATLAQWFHLHGGKGPGWDDAYDLRFRGYYGDG